MQKKYSLILLLLMSFVQLNGQNTFNLNPTSSPRFTISDKVWPANIGEADVCLWNDDKLAAFTLTIDDNNEQNIPFWKTMITKYDFHFSWFVITEAATQHNVKDWSLYNDLANLGSQIDAHDDRNWYNNPADGETNPSDTDYLARLQATKAKINTEVTSGNNNNLTYAYPYGEGNETEARKVFIGIRGTNGVLNQANKVNYLDVNSVSSPHIYNNEANRDKYILPLLNKTNKLYGTNYYRGWASTHFHGLGATGETLADEFLEYLANKSDLWVAGFTEVTQYSQSYATHNLTVDNVAATQIKFTLTDDMLDTAFNFPLSVKIKINDSWASVSATQNGNSTEAKIISNNGKKYALVKAVPDLGQVTITGVADTDPAVITPTIGNQAMIEEATLQLDFSASTTNSDAITFTVANLPSFGAFKDNSDNTGEIVFTPAVNDAGDYQNITIIADNGRSTTSQSFQLSVSPDSNGQPTTEYKITPTGDGIISHVDNIDAVNPSPYLPGNSIDGTTVLKVGKSGSGGGSFSTNAIIPFKLPVRPAGKLVTAANLKVNIAYMRDWISSDLDLYGLPYNASNSISSNDFYDGNYTDYTGTATKIQDAYFVRDVPTGPGAILVDREANSNTVGSTTLVAYINAQYDAGAVSGDYIFLRISVDGTSGSAPGNYYGISDESTDEAPQLTLEIENVLNTKTYKSSKLSLYPNPIKNGDLTISLNGLEDYKTHIEIYSLTGSLVHKELVKDLSKANFKTQVNLNTGLYIVKLINGYKIKTQKLIVQ